MIARKAEKVPHNRLFRKAEREPILLASGLSFSFLYYDKPPNLRNQTELENILYSVKILWKFTVSFKHFKLNFLSKEENFPAKLTFAGCFMYNYRFSIGGKFRPKRQGDTNR